MSSATLIDEARNEMRNAIRNGDALRAEQILVDAKSPSEFINIWIHDEDGLRSDHIMHAATRRNMVRIVQLLLEHGSVGYQVFDHEGDVPIHTAAANGNLDLIRILFPYTIQMEMDYSTEEPGPPVIVDKPVPMAYIAFFERPIVTDAKMDPGWTPLHAAAEKGQTESIRLLLELSKDQGKWLIDDFGVTKWTPLHFAASRNHPETVKALIEMGSQALTWTTKDDESVYHLPIDFDALGCIPTLNMLFQLGARNLNHRNEMKWSPLHCASFNHSPIVIEWLLSHGAPLDGVDLNQISLDFDGNECDALHHTIVPIPILEDNDYIHECKESTKILRACGLTFNREILHPKLVDLLSEPIEEEEILKIRGRIYFNRSLSERLTWEVI